MHKLISLIYLSNVRKQTLAIKTTQTKNSDIQLQSVLSLCLLFFSRLTHKVHKKKLNNYTQIKS